MPQQELGASAHQHGNASGSPAPVSGAEALQHLTAEQMQQLAEKLYAMLRDDARDIRARRPETTVRR